MEKELSYLVSNVDIQKKFKGQNIKVMIYEDLQKYNSIMSLLPGNLSACFILIRTSSHSGHWTVLCRRGFELYYFDSYGVKVDGEMKNINTDMLVQLGEDSYILTNLINNRDSKFNFSYNNMKFQEYAPDINTCGRWVVVFVKCIFKGLYMKTFQSRMKALKDEYGESYDVLICILWDSF